MRASKTEPWPVMAANGLVRSETDVLDRPIIRIPKSAATPRGFSNWVKSPARPKRVRLRYEAEHIYVDLSPALVLLDIPARAVATLDGFCDWITSDARPERGRFSYLDGELWIDMSPEELETHVKVKGEVDYTVIGLNKERDLGEFYGDGTLLRNQAAGLTTEPDALFVTWKTLKAGRVELKPREGFPGHFMELHGTPDWVLEVLSRSSVTKDTKELRILYHRARIPEFWIIDARKQEIRFQVLVWQRTGYREVRPRDRWYPSKVFGCSFRLERHRNQAGLWSYDLRVKSS